jgi:hypothetical protein
MNNESFRKDDLTGKIVRKAGMEQPSYSFTSKIMEQIRVGRSSEVFIYQPVINRKTWVMLGFAIISVLLVFMFIPASQQPAAIDFVKYITPAQNAMDTAASGFSEKLSFFKSLSWMAVALISGWLVLAMDNFFRRVKTTE